MNFTHPLLNATPNAPGITYVLYTKTYTVTMLQNVQAYATKSKKTLLYYMGVLQRYCHENIFDVALFTNALSNECLSMHQHVLFN